MTIECHPVVSREQWLELRRQDVTASRVGALFQVHPYETALRLYAQMTGTEFEDKPENKVMRRGRWLERVVGDAVTEVRPEWSVTPVGAYYRDPDRRLGATPDFWILNDPRGRGVLQAKSAAPSIFNSEYDGGQAVPEWILWQLRTEMLLTDAAFGAVAVLVVDPYDMDVAITELERDGGCERELLEAVGRFWYNVKLGIEPAPDFERDAATVRALHRREVPGQVCDLSGNNQVPELLAGRAAYLEAIRDNKARCEAIETELRFLLGDAERAEGLADWHMTYRTEHRKEYTVPASSSRVLRIRRKKEST
jgi:predicted phage-related endonuclease